MRLERTAPFLLRLAEGALGSIFRAHVCHATIMPGSHESSTPHIMHLASLAYSTAMTAVSLAGATRPRLTREDVAAASEVADLLGIPVSTVLEYARRGVIPGHKLGRRWIFLRDEIEAAVREAPGVARAPTQLAPRGPANGARKTPKRYPETVPSPASRKQRTLFG
jgi:excisionase family DNA binding protein